MDGHKVIAVDLGAESGRVIAVRFDGAALHMDEVHRFPNVPVAAGGTLYWDVLRLWQDIRTGVEAASAGALGVGIDTWGVDFALLDRDKRLVGNPVHYRDPRTDPMMDWVFERIPRRTIFERTGIQFMQLNGLYQLASLIRANSPQLEIAENYLTIADLFNHWLTGGDYVGCEYTHATTHQLVSAHTGDWDWATLDTLGVRRDLMAPICQPGTQIGTFSDVPVLLTACHDTGSAVVAVPTTTEDYAYISSGTWSLVGLEVRAPIINDAAYAANATNEGGVDGTFRLLRNVAGMWLAQQSRATWREDGEDYSYDQLAHLATEAEPFRSFIDVDDHRFLAPGDIPARIRAYCQETGQPVPDTHGAIMRTIYESLALKYRYVLERLVALAGRTLSRVHIVGGGSRNALLCQMTADACNRPVLAGPVEATALGNALVQLKALGVFASIAEARLLLSRDVNMVAYQPKHVDAWEDAYGRFSALLDAAPRS